MRTIVYLLCAVIALTVAFSILRHTCTYHSNVQPSQNFSNVQEKSEPPVVTPTNEAGISTVDVGNTPRKTAPRQVTAEPPPVNPAQQPSKSQKTLHDIDRIEIAGTNIFLFFEGEGLTQDLQETIVSDLARSLSGVDHVEWKSISHPIEWRGKKITHKLSGWEGAELPKAIEKFFGAGFIVDGQPKALIIQELIDAYKTSHDIKKKYPAMFSSLNDFLALLSNQQQLQKLVQNAETASQGVYFYKRSSPQTEQSYKELVRYSDLRIQTPSVLDIQPLAELMQDDHADNDIFAFSAVVSDPQHEKHTMKMPVGAYVNGQWRILVVPMP